MIGVICQARSGSKRFPKKIYEDINGKYSLQRVMEGVFSAQLPQKIILALPKYDEIEIMARIERGDFTKYTDDRFCTFFGSSDDLIDRYFKAARKYELDTIVRITCDCVFTQGWLIDDMLLEYLNNGYSGYMCNTERVAYPFFPDGTDIEIFSYAMLAEEYIKAKDPYEREHCTPYFYRNPDKYNIYPFKNLYPNKMISNKYKHFSFDTPSDLILIKGIATEYDKHGDLDRAIKECLWVEYNKPV